MELTEESTAHVTILSMTGRLDVRTVPRFSSRLAELLRSSHAQVLLEVSGLSYVSSAGCRALLIAAKDAASRGGKLVMCSMTLPVRHIVEMAGLDEVFETFPSREEALARLSAG
jgi:anti-sigma B factor antagonist